MSKPNLPDKINTQWRKIMKKIIIASLTASVMFLFTAPVYADSIEHQWNCKRLDSATTDDVKAATSVWLKAAKTNEGGENIKAFLKFPIAVDTVDGDFTLVVVFADTKTWGEYTHDYANSPAGAAEDAWYEVATCLGSSIWESVAFETL